MKCNMQIFFAIQVMNLASHLLKKNLPLSDMTTQKIEQNGLVLPSGIDGQNHVPVSSHENSDTANIKEDANSLTICTQDFVLSTQSWSFP